MRLCPAHPCLSTLHHLVVVKLDIHDAVLRNRLHRHALEVDGHSPLQLVRAHVQDLDTLAEGDVRVVVFVEDGETVVSALHGHVSDWPASTQRQGGG